MGNCYSTVDLVGEFRLNGKKIHPRILPKLKSSGSAGTRSRTVTLDGIPTGTAGTLDMTSISLLPIARKANSRSFL